MKNPQSKHGDPTPQHGSEECSQSRNGKGLAASGGPGTTRRSGRKGNRGIALVIVLAVMALATILIMSFISLATSEKKAATTYSRGLQAQQVAEQAVNLVIAQIRKATSQRTWAWASQPGAIRTWAQTGNNGFVGYKLYSDEKLEEQTEAAMVDTDFTEAKNWANLPNQYVDLNEPVIRGTKVYFPIVDPLARDEPRWPQKRGEETDDRGVEGFDFNYDAGLSIAPGPFNQEVNSRHKIGHLPMPVKWIYQLRDGTLGTLDSSNRFVPMGSGVSPSRDNQIVGRFAFWADDETAKLNLNVAAGGLTWDTPRNGGEADMDMARFQPAQHEWQRYPGHPASTHLAPVLAPGVIDLVRNALAMEMIYTVVPRVVGGGSVAGSRKVNPANPLENNGLIPDKNPLFPSVDEYVMRPSRDPNLFPQADGRPAPEGQMQEILERVRFFLTTTSRAPETTVFNTPRVCIWPVHESKPGDGRYATYHAAFDKMMAYCSSLGRASNGNPYEYIFRRGNSDSSSYDYYQITRNQQLYKYLATLMQTPVPGVGKSFADKYSTQDRYQILTEIFDYIRSTNLHDDTLFADNWQQAFQAANSAVHRTYTNPRSNNPNIDGTVGETGVHKGHGQVVPIRITEGGVTTKGFGRFYTLRNVAFMAIACAKGPTQAASVCGFRGGGGLWPQAAYEWFGGQTNGNTFNGYYEESKSAVVDSLNGPIRSNFPPMHAGAVLDNADTYPAWLKTWLSTNSPKLFQQAPQDYYMRFQERNTTPEAGQRWQEVVDFVRPAFDRKNWNFNLLYKLPSYPWNQPQSRQAWWTANNAILATVQEADIRMMPGQAMVQAALVFDMFCPSMGYAPINPDMSVNIVMNGKDSGAFTFSSINGRGTFLCQQDDWWFANRRDTAYHDRNAGGVKPVNYFLSRSGGDNQSRHFPTDADYGSQQPFNKYPWITAPFVVNDGPSGKLTFSGGDLQVKVYAHGQNNENSQPQSASELVQTIGIQVGSWGNVLVPNLASGMAGYVNEFNAVEAQPMPPFNQWSLTRESANPFYGPHPSAKVRGGGSGGTGGRGSRINFNTASFFSSGDVVQAISVLHGDNRMTAIQDQIAAGQTNPASGFGYFGGHFNYDAPGANYGDMGITWESGGTTTIAGVNAPEAGRMAHDIGFTIGVRYAGASGPGVAARKLTPGNLNYAGRDPYTPIGPVPLYARSNVQRYGDFDNGVGLFMDGPYINKPDEGNTHSLYNRSYGGNDTGPGYWESRRDYGEYPYFARDWIHEAASPSYFSPNRIMPGPGIFGSLPSRAGSNMPWQTLLFRPNASGYSASNTDGVMPSHPGAGDPHDHYLLDFFWMPVVEPYAISDPMSTAGKINLNSQLLPFRHVKRESSLRGVLRSEFMVCLPTVPGPATTKDFAARNYKHGAGRGQGWHWKLNPSGGEVRQRRLRSVILEERTIAQFYRKFNVEKTIFRSPSQICEIHLVPQQAAERAGLPAATWIPTYTPKVTSDGKVPDMESGKYWADHTLVGDNARERPYADIHQRVTTKSNTFLVHYRGEVIKQGQQAGRDYGRFDPEMDTVAGAYRGSSTVERYVDPNDPRLPDYATAFASGSSSGQAIGDFYRFRILNPARFAP